MYIFEDTDGVKRQFEMSKKFLQDKLDLFEKRMDHLKNQV